MRQSFSPPITGVVLNLLILNVLMFVGTYIVLGSERFDPQTGDYTYLGRLVLAAFLPGSPNFQPWQMLTHMFMHGDIMHLAFNMLSLYIFGTMIEMTWQSPQRFLFYYLFCGVGAWALHLGTQYWELQRMGIDPSTWNGPMLGASGAVFGIMVAYAYYYPDREIRLFFPPIGMKAKYFVLIMAGAELFYGVRGAATGIAHFAHLGGALCGFLLLLYWNKGRLR
jgi:membrane associated rhomboid family serine protease